LLLSGGPHSADDASAGYVNGSHVLLKSTGAIMWPVQVRARSLCDVDMTYFPFDDQLCSLRFGSWLYSDQRVVFNVRRQIFLFLQLTSYLFIYLLTYLLINV